MTTNQPCNGGPRYDSSGNLLVNHTGQGAIATVAIPSGSGNTVVSATAGQLCSVLVTATGTGGPTHFYDNATTNSGTVVGYIPASPTVGTIYNFNMPVANGIVFAGAASSPTLTVSYS